MQYWKQLSARVAKMALRERVMVFAGLVLVIYLLVDTTLIAPMLARQKAARDQYVQRQNQINALNLQLQNLSRAGSVDPDAANRTKLEALRQRTLELEAQAKARTTQLISAQRMRSVLQQIVASRPGLELVELKTVPPTLVTLSGEEVKAEAAQKASKPEKDTPQKDTPQAWTLYKHGVQLTVRGRYLDLLAYLKQIEALPVTLYWDRLELTVLDHPTLALRFTLYTVSLDKAWLQV